MDVGCVIDRVKDRKWGITPHCSNQRDMTSWDFRKCDGQWCNRGNGCEKVRYRRFDATG